MFRYKWHGKQYKVEFFHTDEGHRCVTCPWTRQTTCVIVEENPKDGPDLNWGMGVAMCSKKDQFDRSKGRELSFARAVQSFVPKAERLDWWKAFWESDDGNKTDGAVAAFLNDLIFRGEPQASA